MSKSKDKVLNDMRIIAISQPANANLIALLALTAALNHLQAHENPNLFHDFIQIICRPANFRLSYEQLSHVCYYNEKTTLPLLIARFTEYKLTSSLNNNIPALRALKYSNIIALIEYHSDSEEAKHLSSIFCNYFFKNDLRIAI